MGLAQLLLKINVWLVLAIMEHLVVLPIVIKEGVHAVIKTFRRGRNWTSVFACMRRSLQLLKREGLERLERLFIPLIFRVSFVLERLSKVASFVSYMQRTTIHNFQEKC